MSAGISPERLSRCYQTALDALLAERTPEGFWIGELSASALSTAATVCALARVLPHTSIAIPSDLVRGGLAWLAGHQNADAGWGDMVNSVSNITTTMLCRAAFHLSGYSETADYVECVRRADCHLAERYGETPGQQAEAVRVSCGQDRTFAASILMACALAGLLPWREVPALPLERACLPQAWFRSFGLAGRAFAAPAVIAVGRAVYSYRTPRNPIARFIRGQALAKSLRVLQALQPSSGGFFEDVLQTSFVVLGLASIGLSNHAVTRGGVEFLLGTVRSDGAWPIMSNLAVGVTTLAIDALATAGELPRLEKRQELRTWLLRLQTIRRHPCTGVHPGGWGWTDRSGSVPNGEDTSGALIALAHLADLVPDEPPYPSPRALIRCHVEALPLGVNAWVLPRLPDLSWEARPPVADGLAWLRRLQNPDGGWPTFYRGRGKLSFDRSGSELTASVLRAFAAWQPQIEADREHAAAMRSVGPGHGFAGFPLPAVEDETAQGLEFLAQQQRADGSWLPLSFGNPQVPNAENPTRGTSRVLAAYRDLHKMDIEPARRGVTWLVTTQKPDGGWGGAPGAAPSVEESALAVAVLLDAGAEARAAVNNGLAWLVQQVEVGGLKHPTPIAHYLAKRCYVEKLYPLIFTVAALGRACLRYARI
jgi:squalene-hopene/tetraprenyl-beta-curcumene cyclase